MYAPLLLSHAVCLHLYDRPYTHCISTSTIGLTLTVSPRLLHCTPWRPILDNGHPYFSHSPFSDIAHSPFSISLNTRLNMLFGYLTENSPGIVLILVRLCAMLIRCTSQVVYLNGWIAVWQFVVTVAFVVPAALAAKVWPARLVNFTETY